ncbi:MAG: ATP-binding cassette domain-containing protein [Eggerthellaceae bacterium]|jgi:iron complex transport system ATP-binding protein
MSESPKPGTETGVSTETLVPFLKLTDASVRRAGRVILHVDHLEIAEGENIAILGPNGSGKSTFVKLITREVMPLYRDVPPVLFRGNPRATLVDVRRALGIVSSTMQSEITVHLPAVDIVAGGLTGTVGLPLRISADAADNARFRARAALEQVGIANLADQDVMTMSTGQARRILIARSLVHGPDALMFDEPCTGLDPQGMYYVRKTLRALTQAGKSIVMVTHYPEDIIPEITRIILIKDGEVFADGPKEELLRSETISRLFDVPVKINCEQGYYSLVSPY